MADERVAKQRAAAEMAVLYFIVKDVRTDEMVV